jgi:FkbM family methyltransferase
VRPASIIDLGAAVGEWSELAYSVFPDADFVLVEPLRERTATLAAFSARHPRMCHVAAAAGASQGQVTFDVSSDLDGSGVYGGTLGSGRVVPVKTVDAIVRANLPTFPVSAIRATLNDTAAHSMVRPNLNDGKFLGWRRCSTKATPRGLPCDRRR